MDFLKTIWNRYTFLCILILTSLPLMILGYAGRSGIYSEYEFSPLKEPGLSLVMEGIHDGIYPWRMVIKEKEPEEEEINETDAASSADTGSMEIPADGASGETQTAGGSSGKTGAEGSAQQESDKQDSVEIPEDADKSSSVEEIQEIPEGAVTGDPDVLPEGVCNPVMQAEDYDVVNVAFLSPDDTEYNTDTEGMFAKNGIYYKLQSVDSSYFSDAFFIGDSRTVGLCEYGSLRETAAFLAKESINVYNILEKELHFTDFDGESWDSTLEEALDKDRFGKVYVSLGVNELGIGTTYMYYEKYRELLELIREYQPDAIIYIQGIMHVSYEKSSTDSCRNNTVISQRNYAISTLANGRDIFYIDMNPYVCDGDGDLIEDLSGDGIHLKASAYELWDRCLMENAIVKHKKE